MKGISGIFADNALRSSRRTAAAGCAGSQQRHVAMMKRFFQHAVLVVLGTALGLAIVEIILIFDGRYENLVSQKLVASPAIWEHPVNTVEIDKHPDLNASIEINFDSEGVRNHSGLSTRDKKNIIAFFGDSFVENRRIEDRFSFTSILDKFAGARASVVNYGVDAYGLDQEYLRYRKYVTHDIKHVVYVFLQERFAQFV
jgi:hypothetical protein